jgi:type IV secretory pathway VirB3-like protein
MQFDGLERYSAAGSGVDCIVLGNSTALMGVDPEALSRGYRERTGHELRCFNFGVSGMTASAAGAVAPVLLSRYRPSLLVYIVTARDVGESVEGPLLANTPWVRYQRGTFSLNGWLVEHSSAFRYFLLYRQWLEPSSWPAATSPSGTTAEGFFPIEASLPLSPKLWAHTQRVYADVAARPPSQVELDGFSGVVQLWRSGAQVFVVEAPLHEKLQRWVRHDSTFHADAMAHLRQAARQQHVPFWRVPTWRVIPTDGWADFVHLNRRGAAQFSEWLGARLADAEHDGRLREPRPKPSRA